MKETGEIERDMEEMEQEKKDDDYEHLQVSKRMQPWTKQITIRGVIASIFLGTVYTVIAMKLNLTIGILPNLNVSAALLAFVYMKTWTKILQKSGIATVPFTRHENTMIQTCSVACYSIAIGGFNLLNLPFKYYNIFYNLCFCLVNVYWSLTLNIGLLLKLLIFWGEN